MPRPRPLSLAGQHVLDLCTGVVSGRCAGALSCVVMACELSNILAIVLKLVSRSNPEPFYRSDATYFERLWAEALIDMSPEEVAESLRTRL